LGAVRVSAWPVGAQMSSLSGMASVVGLSALAVAETLGLPVSTLAVALTRLKTSTPVSGIEVWSRDQLASETVVSGLVKVPGSALKEPQLSPARVALSRVTVRVEVSSPEPPSEPSPSVKLTEAEP